MMQIKVLLAFLIFQLATLFATDPWYYQLKSGANDLRLENAVYRFQSHNNLKKC